MRGKKVFLLALVALLLWSVPASAARVVIVNQDDAGVGFNDPTPVSPVGLNTGATLGEQRLFAFEKAAEIWGSALYADVEIRVGASWAALTCVAGGGAILGQAGAAFIFRDFSGAPLTETWYASALAKALYTGAESFDPDAVDIVARFNSSIDEECMAAGSGFYYGLDNAPPLLHADILPVLLHEIAHGLGFATYTDKTTGEMFMGSPDVYMRRLYDTDAGLHWDEMATDAERAASCVNCGGVVWDGASVTAQVGSYLPSGVPTLRVDEPADIAGDYAVGAAAFGPVLDAVGVSGAVEAAMDGVDVSTDGCEPLVGFTPGRIALIDRGACAFTQKVENAEAAGAVAAIIVDTGDSCPVANLGGVSDTNIPSVHVGLSDGTLIREGLAAGVEATLLSDLARRKGVDAAGRILMYAPTTIAAGSSISHFDTTTGIPLLMWPSLAKADYSLDLTPALLRDIGWPPTPMVAPLYPLLGD